METDTDQEDNLWTAEEIAKVLSCSVQHVLRLAILGDIPAIDLALPGAKQHMWRFEPQSIRDWFKDRQRPTKQLRKGKRMADGSIPDQQDRE